MPSGLYQVFTGDSEDFQGALEIVVGEEMDDDPAFTLVMFDFDFGAQALAARSSRSRICGSFEESACLRLGFFCSALIY